MKPLVRCHCPSFKLEGSCRGLQTNRDFVSFCLVAEYQQIYLRSVAPYGDRIHFVEYGDRPLPGVLFLSAPGHTAGHSAIEITSDGSRIVVSGDTWVTKVRPLSYFINDYVRKEFKTYLVQCLATNHFLFSSRAAGPAAEPGMGLF